MSKTINFVQDRRKSISLVEQHDQVLLRKMVVVFVGVALLCIVVFSIRFFFSYQLTSVLEKQKATRASIVQQEAVEREYSIFAHKLTLISSLWGKRQDKQEAVAFFMRLFTGDTTVSGLSYSAETEALTFRLRANSVFVLENALNTLASQSVLGEYPKIAKSDLSRSDDASYSLNVTVVLGAAEGQK